MTSRRLLPLTLAGLALVIALVLSGLLIVHPAARALPPAGSDYVYATADVLIKSRIGTETVHLTGTATITNTPTSTRTPTKTPTATPTRTPTSTPTPVRNGDGDCDGSVTPIDAALDLQLGAGLIGSLPCGASADVNADGNLDALDAALVLQFVAGLLSHLPV